MVTGQGIRRSFISGAGEGKYLVIMPSWENVYKASIFTEEEKLVLWKLV